MVSGTRDGRVVLWCLESYSIIQELPAHNRQVNGVRFSSDAKRVVSCGSDFYMKVIDLQTGTILFSKGRHYTPMFLLTNISKVVVTFYLRLRNELQPFPAKNQASYWLTYWVSHSEAWFLIENGWNSFLNLR